MTGQRGIVSGLRLASVPTGHSHLIFASLASRPPVLCIKRVLLSPQPRVLACRFSFPGWAQSDSRAGGGTPQAPAPRSFRQARTPQIKNPFQARGPRSKSCCLLCMHKPRPMMRLSGQVEPPFVSLMLAYEVIGMRRLQDMPEATITAMRGIPVLSHTTVGFLLRHPIQTRYAT